MAFFAGTQPAPDTALAQDQSERNAPALAVSPAEAFTGKFTTRIPNANLEPGPELYVPRNPALAFNWGVTPASGLLTAQATTTVASAEPVVVPPHEPAPKAPANKPVMTAAVRPPQRPASLQPASPAPVVLPPAPVVAAAEPLPAAQEAQTQTGLLARSRTAFSQVASATGQVWQAPIWKAPVGKVQDVVIRLMPW
jgi:hypothetical protein